jgi:adenine phosphoribosyltransferase
MSTDIPAGSKVIIFDDLIATGGSLKAAITLIEKLNCHIVDICVLREVVALREKARETLKRNYTVLLQD